LVLVIYIQIDLVMCQTPC